MLKYCWSDGRENSIPGLYVELLQKLYEWKGTEGRKEEEWGADIWWSCWWDGVSEYKTCFVEDGSWSFFEPTDALWDSSTFGFVPWSLKNTVTLMYKSIKNDIFQFIISKS